MILPNPAYHPPRPRPTCQDYQFAMAYARALTLLRQAGRTPEEDGDLLQAAHGCTECASLLGRHELWMQSVALLIRAQTALGHHQAAAVQKRRLERLVGHQITVADLASLAV